MKLDYQTGTQTASPNWTIKLDPKLDYLTGGGGGGELYIHCKFLSCDSHFIMSMACIQYTPADVTLFSLENQRVGGVGGVGGLGWWFQTDGAGYNGIVCNGIGYYGTG